MLPVTDLIFSSLTALRLATGYVVSQASPLLSSIPKLEEETEEEPKDERELVAA